MDTHLMDRVAAEVERLGMTPLLQSEMDYYRHDIERDEPESLGEALDGWYTRHELEPKAGWLDRPSLRLMRQAYINTGIAQRLDGPQYRDAVGFRIWFQQDGVRYTFDPTDEEQDR